jgi:aspartyl-tRNA synthetase
MLIADEPNLREVYAFVMNGAYEDPMMGAPTDPTPQQLKDLHLKVVPPIKVEAVEKKAQSA